MDSQLSLIIASAQDKRFVRDPFLTEAVMNYNASGTAPKMHAGGFSQVFVMSKDEEEWAFKVWTREIENNRVRYEHIKKYLGKLHLPYFVDFEFVRGGLLVNGELLDTLRMKWINASSLVEFISQNLEQPVVLRTLAKNFKKMTKDLHAYSISHGDLQTGNIFVTPEAEILLIDYDSICVPELEGEADICRGTSGYQHPARLYSGYYASTKVDFFSELIIYISILAIAEHPFLWDKYKVPRSEPRLLFEQEDFLYFHESSIRKDLMLLSDEIKNLVLILDNYLAAHVKLRPFDDCNDGSKLSLDVLIICAKQYLHHSKRWVKDTLRSALPSRLRQ